MQRFIEFDALMGSFLHDAITFPSLEAGVGRGYVELRRHGILVGVTWRGEQGNVLGRLWLPLLAFILHGEAVEFRGVPSVLR